VNNFFIIAPLWRNFTKQLAIHNRILTYDLRNQGSSTPVAGELAFDALVEDLKHLLDALGIEQTYLVGTSTSTVICRDFTLRYPERVRGLIMVGPLFCPYGSRRRKFLTKSWLNTIQSLGAKGLFDHIYPLIYSDRTIENGGTPAFLALRERFLAVNSTVQLKQFLNASLTTDDEPEKLCRIQRPTLLMAGESDFLSSESSLMGACKLLPQGQFEIVHFAGHVPYFEATEVFEQRIQQFIDEIEARDVQQRMVG
jgi:pimeloyl-ACP methyl ester carboxylesterase